MKKPDLLTLLFVTIIAGILTHSVVTLALDTHSTTETIKTLEEEITSLKTELNTHKQYHVNREDVNELIKAIQDLERGTDFRIKMVSSELLQLRIELDSVSHEDCESKLEELWEEVNYIRKTVE
jgi:hypothetical protein